MLSDPSSVSVNDCPVWASRWGEDSYGAWAILTFDNINQRLRWIPPGCFLMGAPTNEPGCGTSEHPQHEVQITKGFWLFDTPITYALWNAVHGDGDNFDYPVVSVSWEDVERFIAQINALRPNLNLCLPTEAQWEYACRAGTTTPTYATETESLTDIAWFNGNSKRTQPVARKRCNPWGLYDMLGNVWEWCADDLRAYGKPQLSTQLAPLTAKDGLYAVVPGFNSHTLPARPIVFQ